VYHYLGGIANAEQGNPFTGNVAHLSQLLQAIGFAVVFCHHTQACETAVFGVELAGVGERNGNHFIY